MKESRPESTGGNNQDKLINDQEATRTAKTVIDLLREMELFGNHTPKGADPVAFPLQVLSEAQYVAGMRDYETGYKKILGERLAPYKKTLQKVEMAYEIIAYPLLENSAYGMSIREGITDAEIYPNERTDEYPHRGPIALNDAELKILGQITQDRGLPFNPEKKYINILTLSPDAMRARKRSKGASGMVHHLMTEPLTRASSGLGMRSKRKSKRDRRPGREANQPPPNHPQSRRSKRPFSLAHLIRPHSQKA